MSHVFATVKAFHQELVMSHRGFAGVAVRGAGFAPVGAGLAVLLLSILLPPSVPIVAAGPPSAASTNYALAFDGQDDCVIVPDPLNFSGSFTIEAWVKVSDFSPNGRIVTNRESSAGYELSIDPNGALRFVFNGSIAVQATFIPGLDTWAHVAAQWDEDAGKAELYIDGVYRTAWSVATPANPSTRNLRIGKYGTSSTLDGVIDEVRIWSAAIDTTTIANWRSRTLDPGHPNWSDLVGYWTFDEGTGQTAASAVNSPAYDAILGDTAGVEATDPVWTIDAPTAIEPMSFGKLKSGYR